MYEVKALRPNYFEMKLANFGTFTLMSDTSDFNWLSREIMGNFFKKKENGQARSPQDHQNNQTSWRSGERTSPNSATASLMHPF